MNIDLSKIKHVHFIGVGGIGISAIARMMKEEGKIVTANDLDEFDIVAGLRSVGIDTTIGKEDSVIPVDTDLIVYSIAWTTLGPELLEYAKSLSVPMLSYPDMLGVITAGKYTISVSGTHGKTTTTGMIAQILRDNKKDPTVVVGSLLKVAPPLTPPQITREGDSSLSGTPERAGGEADWTNFIHGQSNLFVVESCEYRRSFLNINPNILVITNVDADHLDYYKDIKDIKNAFHELAMKVPTDGYIVCDPMDTNIADVINGVQAKIVDCKEFFNPQLALQVPGVHNKKDAACAVAVATLLGISLGDAESAVINFPGTWRRFEYKGTLASGAKVYDDYAHAPAEIMATLSGFRELYKSGDGWKITIVFQPHLFSRTKSLLSDFAKSFAEADSLLLLPIYPAREVDDGTISSEILAIEINKFSNNAKSFPDFESVADYVKNLNLDDKNILVTMGAGDADQILKVIM